MWSLIRRDIGEFVSTVKDDAAKTLKSAMALGEEGDEDYDSYYDSDDEDYDEDYDEGTEGDGDGDDRWRNSRASRGQQRASAALRAMRSDIKTYTEGIPEADAARFGAFTKSFDVGARTEEIATLLKEDPVVTKIHTQLVPQHVSYDDFWSRYFFRAERLAQREVGGGRSFPRHDEEEDEEFAWGDDDQDDEGHDRQKHADTPAAVGAATGAPAGGALGAMDVAHQDSATTSSRRDLEDSALVSVPGGRAGKDRSSGGEVAVAAGEAAVSAEIARLTEALRSSEAERASLAEALANSNGKIEKMAKERDTALEEVVELKGKVRQSEKDLEQAAATVAELVDATATARRDSDARLGKLQDTLDASEARAAAAEKEAEESFASRKEAMAAAAARIAAGSDGNEDAAAMAAEAEAAAQEVSRLKKVLREERAQHEEMLLASRQAANEAVEATLSSADADREEACAEATASMRAENERKAEELNALRAQLAKSAAAMEEIGTLKADVDELRRAVESERAAASKAAGEAKQEVEVAKQLREEVRALRAAADQARNPSAVAKGSAGGLMKRGTNRTDKDIAGEDTDDWGDDEYDSCCAASNSSGVVVDRPPSLASPDADKGRGRPGDRQNDDVAAAAIAAIAGDDRSVGPGVAGRSEAPGSATQERTGRGQGGGEGEGDDGWEGWD